MIPRGRSVLAVAAAASRHNRYRKVCLTEWPLSAAFQAMSTERAEPAAAVAAGKGRFRSIINDISSSCRNQVKLRPHRLEHIDIIIKVVPLRSGETEAVVVLTLNEAIISRF